MDELHAIIGRKQVELDNLKVEYGRLLGILYQVSTGEISTDRIGVDLQRLSWSVGPEKVPAVAVAAVAEVAAEAGTVVAESGDT